ncbi:hypothetical protein [Nocardioides flavescens]|uniref:Uncharacterized protein n=1 Tax=Nocardioides flavescens TaxID=2691959 RepID=A0A6L7EYX7_9ACTN|nr:hypothetical protein [Nocardioides flavescens]MXG91356.1 hypothetical protein [Nocardioides flavescens]
MSEHLTLSDPRPGTIVELGAGEQLCLRFRPRLGASRWRVAAHPGHLLPLEPASGAEPHELHFLAFGGAAGTLRLERRHPDREIVHEVCEVEVVPLGLSDAARTPTSAARRTA